MQAEIESKLQQAKAALLETFESSLAGVLVIGSAVAEPTPTSDIDVAVVLQDRFYRQHLDEIKSRLTEIANAVNARRPDHELVLWATKVDHYYTLLPDVSFVRANLPASHERLDAWCGLAKHTLIHYESETSRAVHGNFEIEPVCPSIPKSEAVELFLLATRTLAEGLVETSRGGPRDHAGGQNHLAKAGLRAAYAVMIAEDGVARNSYAEILRGALQALPTEYHSLLRELYATKTGAGAADLRTGPIVQLLEVCELRIAAVPRLQMGGLAAGQAGESFAFSIEDITGSRRTAVEEYSRFPGLETNYIHSFYFLLTAREVLRRLIGQSLADRALDFFFEEITVIASFALFNPHGVKMVVGQAEREDIDLIFETELLQGVFSLLVQLAEYLLEPLAEAPERPWLRHRQKLARLRVLCEQLPAVLGVEVSKDVQLALESAVLPGDFLTAVEWQCQLLSGAYGLHLVEVMGRMGLTLYQSGENEMAQRVLRSVVSVRSLKARARRSRQEVCKRPQAATS